MKWSLTLRRNNGVYWDFGKPVTIPDGPFFDEPRHYYMLRDALRQKEIRFLYWSLIRTLVITALGVWSMHIFPRDIALATSILINNAVDFVHFYPTKHRIMAQLDYSNALLVLSRMLHRNYYD